jgi:hypothetical protein
VKPALHLQAVAEVLPAGEKLLAGHEVQDVVLVGVCTGTVSRKFLVHTMVPVPILSTSK